MKNLRMSVPLVDGSLYAVEFRTGKDLIQQLLSDDWGPPPRCLRIEANAEDGTRVVLSIPYTDSDTVGVSIEKEEK